jgi:hypothetical protein
MTTYTSRPSPSPATVAEPTPVAAPTPAPNAKQYQQLEEGTQWVPAPKPPTLLEILPAEYATTRPPLLYRLSSVSEPTLPDGRIGESRTYRAKAFSCGYFYKPISRCMVGWEDRRQDQEPEQRDDR